MITQKVYLSKDIHVMMYSRSTKFINNDIDLILERLDNLIENYMNHLLKFLVVNTHTKILFSCHRALNEDI